MMRFRAILRAAARVPMLAIAIGTAACSTTAESRPDPSVASPAPASEPAQLTVEGVTLHGTLELPVGSCAAPSPVALIIAGSGPTDRDGNSAMLMGDNDSLRMLAEDLARECVASLRYDKRGVAESTAPGMREDELRFTTYADDAAAWVAHLRADARFDGVIVIGHSEGALLGTLAARTADADGLVLIAGAGRPIGETLRDQLRAGMPEAMYRQADSILVELEVGRTVTNIPGSMLALFRPSVQPYLISWLPLDPAEEVARLDIPVLVVWGTTDLQALRADAERLGGVGNDVRLVVIDGMNHVLKQVSGTLQEQLPSYTDPTLPLAAGLVPAIVEYLREDPSR